MSSYNRSNQTHTGGKKGFFSKTLKTLSSWGMYYDDMVLRNSQAVGEFETPTVEGQDLMYDTFSRNAVSQMFQKKSIAALDRSIAEKKRILREYSRKDEIRDFIAIVADESVIYDEQTDFCFPTGLPEEFDKEVKDAYLENFQRVYYNWGFGDGIVAWNYFRELLIDGYLAYEIVFDDKQRNVEGFNKLEPSSIIPAVDQQSGAKIWIQFPDNPQYRRVLLDSQIIYISYSAGTDYNETSYVENLIRPYNQLKLLEQTRIMFNISNAMMFKKFVIPVGGMSKQLAEEQVAKLIADYKDEVTFNNDMGTVSINGSPNIPYSKEYWFPEGESGTPQVDLIDQQGHNLNENDMLTWFYNALKRASKIPFSRFDKTNGGGSIFGDVADMPRDELTFFNFVTRLRTVFKEIIVKPWKIQMLLDYPELKSDENFVKNINVEFNGVNLFHEWKKLNNIAKRADIASTLGSSILDAEGNPYFHVEWVVRDILKVDEETLRENESWKKKKGGAPAGEGGGGDFDLGGSDEGGGEDFDLGGSDEGGGDEGGEIPDLGGDEAELPDV